MASKQHILRFVDAGGEVRRTPLVGMQFLDERAVGARDVLGACPGLKTKNLVGLLFRHFSRGNRTAAPRCRIVLRVFTPAGILAVKIRCQ